MAYRSSWANTHPCSRPVIIDRHYKRLWKLTGREMDILEVLSTDSEWIDAVEIRFRISTPTNEKYVRIICNKLCEWELVKSKTGDWPETYKYYSITNVGISVLEECFRELDKDTMRKTSVHDLKFSNLEYTVRYEFHEHIVFAIVIPDQLPPSFNDMVKKPWEQTLKRRRWFDYFFMKNAAEIPNSTGKRTVRIDLFKRAQFDDAPNLEARSKVILDSLKIKGKITDDNNRFLDWARVWQNKDKEDCTVILISETLDSEMMMELHDLPKHAKQVICKRLGR